MARPVLFVLAGVNGAGKSSVGGHLIERAGLTWFNPDTFARELMAATGCDRGAANAHAWAEGVRRLDNAISDGRSHACETTLGGRTMASKIRAGAATHDVLMWFFGLDSPDRHVRRVRGRVAAGGHDIPERRIRQRYPRALENLVALMPHVTRLQVFDNSADVAPGDAVPDPVQVLDVTRGRVTRPALGDQTALGRTPDWAKPLVEAALSLTPRSRP